MSNSSQPVVLAFSGGLDTSFCVPWLKETCGRPVVTVTVNTGGIDAAEAQALAEKSAALGAGDHILVEARGDFFDQVLKYLIMGNVRRGQMYPLCVGAERGIQARCLAEAARKLGSGTVAHGCTAAGNDQVRFEIVLKTLAPELEVLAPVRGPRLGPAGSDRVPGRPRDAIAGGRFGVFDQPRAVGRHHRGHGDAGFRSEYSRVCVGPERRRSG